jgi:hypothetical protein
MATNLSNKGSSFITAIHDMALYYVRVALMIF